MATKAQQFKSKTQQDVGPKKPKQPPRPRRDIGVDTSLPGVSATDRKRGDGHTAERNPSQHAARKATFKLEDSAQDRPSRKSTRKSANSAKSDSNLRRRQTRTARSPATRAAKAAARKA